MAAIMEELQAATARITATAVLRANTGELIVKLIIINYSPPAPATSVNVKLASGSWEEDSDTEADMVEVSVEVTLSEVAWVEDMEERLITGNNV